jgi:hypothetical protein
MSKIARFGACLLLFAAIPAFADMVTFNFEGLADTSDTGHYTSLSQTVDGITMTVTRVGGNHFDIINLSSSMPSADGWGSSSLSPFFDTSNSAFIFTFSQPVSAFSVQVGDFGADFDTQSGTAFSGANGTGTALGTFGGTWGDGDLGNGTGTLPETDSISAAGIGSIVFIGGSSVGPSSLFYDNIMVSTNTSTTPEPSSVLLLLTGAAGFAGVRLRRRTA